MSFILAGCNSATPEPTATPAPTNTPQPTDMPTPVPTDTPTATASPTPTLTPTLTPTITPDRTATAAVEANEAMAALEAEIDAELQAVGFSTEGGRLGYRSDGPVPLRLTTYNTHNWLPLANGKEFSNIVLRADVIWESTSGLALCGFWFRGQGEDKDAEHYSFEAIRLSGLPVWSVEYWNFNRIVSHLTSNPRVSPEINQDQGGTNEYLFVADGNELHIQEKGESLGRVTINWLREGIVTLYIRQESGETTCTFDNVLLWELGEQSDS